MTFRKARSQLVYEDEDENVDIADNSGESSSGDENNSDSVTTNDDSDCETGGVEEEDFSEPVAVHHSKKGAISATNVAPVVTSIATNHSSSKRGPGRPRAFFGLVAAEESPPTIAANRLPRNLNNLLIVQPGARWLRVARASDKAPPRYFAHCLARRRPITSSSSKLNGVGDGNDDNHFVYSESNVAEVMHDAATLLSRNATELLALREKARIHNSHLKTSKDEKVMLTDTSDVAVDKLDDILVGDDALKCASDSRYRICWPWRNGQLCTHAGVGGSLTALTEDLVDLWSRLLQRVTSDLKSCNVLLLVGDLVPRVQLRLLSEVLLARLGLAGIMLVHEPVCAAFGVGLPSTCVVDLGANKVSVSYVEDGVSLSPARLLLSYGSDGITHFFHHLINKELSAPTDLTIKDCEKMKIAGACHLETQRFLQNVSGDDFLSVRYPHDTEERLKLADCGFLASLFLFRPDVALVHSHQTNVMIRRYVPPQDAPLPDDVFDELYAICTAREQRVIDSTEGNKTTTTSGTRQFRQNKVIKHEVVPLGLDAAVLEALERLEPAARHRALNSVVLVGGGAVLPGLAEALRKRIASRLGQHLTAAQVEVHADFSEASAADVTWRGAQILAENADYLEELWISPKEWVVFGSRLLRERCPFVF